MKDFIEINGEHYPLRFDGYALMHLERWLKRNVFLYMRDEPGAIERTEFLVHLTYSGVFSGLDCDDESTMPWTIKELSRSVTPNDFEKVIKAFGEQMSASVKAVKKPNPEKEKKL